MKKIMLAILLVLCVLFGISENVYATEDSIDFQNPEEEVSLEVKELSVNEAWDGVSMKKPKKSGYEYQIETAAELAWFANEVNQGNTFEGKSIYITGTIDLNKKEWIIIGNKTWENPCEIQGDIIIKDAVISNLVCKSRSVGNGLFGSVRIWNMQIDNLTLEDVEINDTSEKYDGFLFASVELAKGGTCEIKNSNFSGIITKKSNCGGIAGYVSGANDNANLIIENCNIDIESIGYATFVGSKYNADFKAGVIGRYYVTAKQNWLILNGVYCNDNLQSYNEYGYDTCTAGGMIGELEGKANVVVYQCAVTGEIFSSGYCGYAGGIVGKLMSCNIYRQSDTYVTADITSSWNAYGYKYNAGGFLEGPLNEKPQGYIKNSYFAGNSNSATAFIAKDCLKDETGLNIYNCYYDATRCKNNVYHADWKCYVINNTTFECAGYKTEDMSIQSNYKNWDFENIWIMGENYPELRRENFELPDEFLEDRKEEEAEIIGIVREYASKDFYAQWEQIWLSEYSDEVKFEKILALASNYGITDPKEGLEFVSKSSDKRRAYRILTTDEMYMASNFLNWLNEDGNFEKVLLGIDGLLFNREINEWLDISTYIENDYPGISKYKSMLYAYMDSASASIEAWNDVKLVTKLSKNVTDATKIWVNDKITEINALNGPNDRDKRWEIIIELQSKGAFIDVEFDKLDKTKYKYILDEESGFGLFAKAMGLANKTITLIDMTITDIRDILVLDSKLQTYTQFSRFLDDIIEAKKEVPFELRVAASQVKKEMEDGYGTQIKKIAGQVMQQCKISSTVQKSILASLGAESFSSYLSVMNLETWFINQIVDVGSMVKKESYVEGYAYLAQLYNKRLENSRQKFLNSMSEENAWDFYYNYNMLYSLRKEGEKAYLSMCNLKGVSGSLLSFGYAAKEEAVQELLSILDESCKFDLGENTSIPESMEYLSKLVVSCPVDVVIYTKTGECIAELRDGELKDVSNEYGRFVVVYNYYTGDYEKVICLLNEDITIKVEANDMGLVKMKYSYIDENGAIKVLSGFNVSVIEGDVINMTPHVLQESGNAVIENKESTKEITLQEENSYTKVEKAYLSEEEITLIVGEKKLLTVEIEPITASIQEVVWYSSDEEIASVKNGCVKALQEGTVTIYGFLQ